MMYRVIRPLLFRMDPEKAHRLALSALRCIPAACFTKPPLQKVSAMGLEFAHPIGLAAGLDKNAQYLDALAKLGFSFIEVGTVTPRPQPGNPKPRLFRLPKAQALINRMGFNNLGVDVLVENIQRSHYLGILGINIGKNKDTPLAQAAEDYLYGLQRVYVSASYVVVNISSPNTKDLRLLQRGAYFVDLITRLREEQLRLSDIHHRYTPLVIKISPDETDETLKALAEAVVSQGLDGIVATNTTASRDGVEGLPNAKEEGGLSGAPLATRSTHSLSVLKQVVGDAVTLIGVGGIDSVQRAQEKLQAGASLLQVYTGLIYHGPGLVPRLL